MSAIATHTVRGVSDAIAVLGELTDWLWLVIDAVRVIKGIKELASLIFCLCFTANLVVWKVLVGVSLVSGEKNVGVQMFVGESLGLVNQSSVTLTQAHPGRCRKLLMEGSSTQALSLHLQTANSTVTLGANSNLDIRPCKDEGARRVKG